MSTRLLLRCRDGLAVTPEGIWQGHAKRHAICCALCAGSVRLEGNEDSCSRLPSWRQRQNPSGLRVEVGATSIWLRSLQGCEMQGVGEQGKFSDMAPLPQYPQWEKGTCYSFLKGVGVLGHQGVAAVPSPGFCNVRILGLHLGSTRW